jgi:hypothetical protein
MVGFFLINIMQFSSFLRLIRKWTTVFPIFIAVLVTFLILPQSASAQSTILFSDNFTDVDGTSLSAHNDIWHVTQGAASIQNNTLTVLTSQFTAGVNAYTSTDSCASVDAQFPLTSVLHLSLRTSGPNLKNTYYTIFHSGNQLNQIAWYDENDNQSYIGPVVPLNPPAGWHNVKFCAIGSTLTTYLDNNQLAIVNDTRFTGAGIARIAYSGAGVPGSPLDNFVLESFDPNHAPVLTPIGYKVVDEGQLLEFTINATDQDNDTLTFSAANLPNGATFDPQTAKLSWTPSFNQAGNYPDIEFTVTDDGSPIELDTELITITVGGVNRAPIFDSIDPQAALENELLTFTVSVVDPDGDGFTLSAADVPTGASFNPQTGVFSWTPTLSQAGNYVVAFSSTDNGSPAETGTIDVAITVGDNPTPTEQAENLVDTVVATYDFPTNVENSYLSNLKKVAIFIENNQIQAAINQLNAFITKVNTDYNAGAITQAIRDNLVNLAEALLADLQ